ncbi:MAG: hypothetical protein JW896_03075 [Deltaproteobacteria bacterium]|nr:hypothetical protein [Deltaproteobacteria bacterium]
MIEFTESRVSAHHNYLVNDRLTPGFVVGNPNSDNGFFFLADFLLHGQDTPLISTRLVTKKGDTLLELYLNDMADNPMGCTVQSLPRGFRILNSSSEPLLEVLTQDFPMGHLTRIKAKLFDERGVLRISPLGESIQVHGEARLILDAPFVFNS